MKFERKYQKLVVWQKAMELVTAIYQVTASFPDCEKFGLVSQMRRAAVSIPSNIAEGSGRGSDKDFARFLQIAKGSLLEVETQLLISHKMHYLRDDGERLFDATNEVFAMLTNLIIKMNGPASQSDAASDLRRPTSGL